MSDADVSTVNTGLNDSDFKTVLLSGPTSSSCLFSSSSSTISPDILALCGWLHTLKASANKQNIILSYSDHLQHFGWFVTFNAQWTAIVMSTRSTRHHNYASFAPSPSCISLTFILFVAVALLSSACTCFIRVVVCSLTLVVKSFEPKPDEALKKYVLLLQLFPYYYLISLDPTILIP